MQYAWPVNQKTPIKFSFANADRFSSNKPLCFCLTQIKGNFTFPCCSQHADNYLCQPGMCVRRTLRRNVLCSKVNQTNRASSFSSRLQRTEWHETDFGRLFGLDHCVFGETKTKRQNSFTLGSMWVFSFIIFFKKMNFVVIAGRQTAASFNKNKTTDSRLVWSTTKPLFIHKTFSWFYGIFINQHCFRTPKSASVQAAAYCSHK